MSHLRIEGNFQTGKQCPYHCQPTCHPMVDNTNRYGCTHQAWAANQCGDFVPLVKCVGMFKKCAIPKIVKSRYLKGQRARLRNAEKKIAEIKSNIEFLDKVNQ